MKQFFSGLLVCLLIVTQQEAFAKSPAGLQCKKLNSNQIHKGVKFTCQKAGGRLIWKKVVEQIVDPIISADSEGDFSVWNIKVLNYVSMIKGLDLSYSYSLDGGLWNLFKNSKSESEKLIVNEPFREIEFKVFFVDSSKQVRNSNIVRRVFGKTVNPLKLPTPQASPSMPAVAPTQILNLLGVQWMHLPTEYREDKPFAKVLFRWPKPNVATLGGYLISYENRAQITPPCDLTKALCEPAKRVDEKIYDVVIGDSAIEKAEIGGLQIDAPYTFRFCYIVGDIGRIKNTNCQNGANVVLNTSSEKVPEAPNISIASLASNRIDYELKSQLPNGFKVLIYVAGGKFGAGKTVATLTASGKGQIEVEPGLYIVSAITVSPSGINGSPSDIFSVTVK